MSGCGNSSCSCGASCSCNGCSCKRSLDTFPTAINMEGFENEGCNSSSHPRALSTISSSSPALARLSRFDHSTSSKSSLPASLNMSGCGNSSCSCGASCSCNGCSCKRSFDTFPTVTNMEGFQDEGCKCGDSCSCNPCNCK
ncbi:hypothetical protein Mp_6g20570 [Marchantia polymorpha subsp. ruderalis]|uniref:Metallothionein-like protein n=2 Tax=Marchantia polymorpha TaxID=3197 RepID=A0AAF6BU81_MARPO|nr:hypothetical protein MARPO_0045s0007 [Marchantia polymorpha]BBN15565.1 hypothetical protein Mp_6g20570 [Marchantia polymorpha subsp. ruderalis]|eukprot:PTQ39324.1 hypothetical protein MARPO_0045s0007 [Marchantia polymorpha]